MRPFFAAGLVVIAGLFSQACLFGGGDDPEPTPTVAPSVSTPTPSAADETPTAVSTATPAGDDATPTPDPSAATEYVVQAGDFLSVIAAKFDITVEALAAANGIDDPDKIFVGQVLIIPPRE